MKHTEMINTIEHRCDEKDEQNAELERKTRESGKNGQRGKAQDNGMRQEKTVEFDFAN